MAVAAVGLAVAAAVRVVVGAKQMVAGTAAVVGCRAGYVRGYGCKVMVILSIGCRFACMAMATGQLCETLSQGACGAALITQ